MAYAEKSDEDSDPRPYGGAKVDQRSCPGLGYGVPEFRPFDVRGRQTDPKGDGGRAGAPREGCRADTAKALEHRAGPSGGEAGPRVDAEPGGGQMGAEAMTDAAGARGCNRFLGPRTQRDPFVDGWDSARWQKKQFATWFRCSIQCETGLRSIACAPLKRSCRCILRPVTPIVVPLADGLAAQDIVNPHASVAFDLDGERAAPALDVDSADGRAGWCSTSTARGSITSGLQLFGSVTFWMFWRQGYDALRSLDDDGDGQIAGPELRGLALWHDRNANGRSDPGEVRPVGEWGIVSLSCEHRARRRAPRRDRGVAARGHVSGRHHAPDL